MGLAVHAGSARKASRRGNRPAVTAGAVRRSMWAKGPPTSARAPRGRRAAKSDTAPGGTCGSPVAPTQSTGCGSAASASA
ncbi:MAG: hypothetical protein ACK559_15185, partial [bacterium]